MKNERVAKLEEFDPELSKCLKCGFCREVCPIFAETNTEAFVARGKMALSQAVLAGDADATGNLADIFSYCLMCKACVERCPSGVEACNVMLSARAALGSEMILSKSRAQALKYLLKHPASLRKVLKAGYLGQSLLGKRPWALGWILRRMKIDPERRLPEVGPTALEDLPDMVPAVGEKKIRVGYFVGCGTDLMMPSIASDVVRALSEAGAEVIIPKEQGCCGTPAITSGDLDTAKELASRVIEQFSSLGVDAIVTACASCGHTLRYLYPEFLKMPAGVEVKDFSELLTELRGGVSCDESGTDVTSTESGASIGTQAPVRVRVTDLGLPEGTKVTYHQPCHLNRGQGISVQPVGLLSGIEGLEYIEMEDADRCCGGAGLFTIYHSDMSRKVGERKAETIENTGADIVVTSCPSCMLQLEHLAKVTGANWKVMHIAELLKGGEASGESAPSR
jgi:glycolate oxidase iron-sulfur subunit